MLAMTQYVIPVIIIQLRARPCHCEPRQWRGDPGLQYVARRADTIYWIASLHSQ